MGRSIGIGLAVLAALGLGACDGEEMMDSGPPLTDSGPGGVDSGPGDDAGGGGMDAGGGDAGGSSDAGGGGGGVLSLIEGQWHGQIGPGYRGGCLCLTLDAAGNPIAPSGITLGFNISGGSTTVIDEGMRQIDITTTVEGSEFHIRGPATVDPAGTMIDGQWESEPPGSMFDDTIVLDRDPQSCMDRTGLSGAPC